MTLILAATLLVAQVPSDTMLITPPRPPRPPAVRKPEPTPKGWYAVCDQGIIKWVWGTPGPGGLIAWDRAEQAGAGITIPPPPPVSPVPPPVFMMPPPPVWVR